MKFKTIKYAMLRKTDQFENDRAEIEVEVEEGDNEEKVMAVAKLLCEMALNTEAALPKLSYSDILERLK